MFTLWTDPVRRVIPFAVLIVAMLAQRKIVEGLTLGAVR